MHYATKPILLPAALLLACSLPGFLAARTTSTTDAPGTIDPPTVVGTVIDEQGRPRKGVTVQISGMEKLHPGGWVRVMRLGIMPSFTANERGRFEIEFNEEDLRFDLWCDDWAFAPTFVHAIAADSEDLTIVLKRGVEVAGNVMRRIDGEAHPVSGTTVQLHHPTVDLHYQAKAYTEQDGRYRFRVPDGAFDGSWWVDFLGESVELTAPDGPHFEVTVKVRD